MKWPERFSHLFPFSSFLIFPLSLFDPKHIVSSTVRSTSKTKRRELTPCHHYHHSTITTQPQTQPPSSLSIISHKHKHMCAQQQNFLVQWRCASFQESQPASQPSKPIQFVVMLNPKDSLHIHISYPNT